ncbi:MAG TPA: hypothetical protein PKY56_02580 [Candidatus Kapabacteria bacterium]|nr:hypothetical protein [Candidatus Kapabacteria bacterium]
MFYQKDNYENLKEFIIQWNNIYPIDRWWREKHKIAFNSPAHRSMSFIDMRIEYEEDMLFSKMNSMCMRKYEPGTGDWLVKRREHLSQEQINKMFDDIDLSKFNKNG